MGEYRVTVDYVTTSGNPASIRRTLKAPSLDAAYTAATARVRRMKRCMKVSGGTVEELWQGIPMWGMTPEALAETGREP